MIKNICGDNLKSRMKLSKRHGILSHYQLLDWLYILSYKFKKFKKGCTVMSSKKQNSLGNQGRETLGCRQELSCKKVLGGNWPERRQIKEKRGGPNSVTKLVLNCTIVPNNFLPLPPQWANNNYNFLSYSIAFFVQHTLASEMWTEAKFLLRVSLLSKNLKTIVGFLCWSLLFDISLASSIWIPCFRLLSGEGLKVFSHKLITFFFFWKIFYFKL